MSWRRRGLGLDLSHKHTVWKLERPFCLESRGQLSVCLPISALSPTGGDDGLIQPTPHRQEDREGDPARTESLNLQRASAEKMITSHSPPPLNSGERGWLKPQ